MINKRYEIWETGFLKKIENSRELSKAEKIELLDIEWIRITSIIDYYNIQIQDLIWKDYHNTEKILTNIEYEMNVLQTLLELKKEIANN